MPLNEHLSKIRTIKELLEIDIELIYENSIFKVDTISESDDNRNFLLFDLTSKFLEIFDQYQISIFNGKAHHLEFRTSNYDSDKLRKLIDLIVGAYGTDENDQSSSDWHMLKHMGWWFKNKNHEPTYDDHDNTDNVYYGIMMTENNTNGIELSIINYINIDPIFNKINWLKHRI